MEKNSVRCDWLYVWIEVEKATTETGINKQKWNVTVYASYTKPFFYYTYALQLLFLQIKDLQLFNFAT